MGSMVFRVVASATAVAVVAAAPADATLGRNAATIQQDRVHIDAEAADPPAGTPVAARGYRAHAMRQANGGEVREYAGEDGVVFAVAWRGPGRADLRQLLGDGFATMQAARSGVGVVARRSMLAVTTPALVVRSLGHPGGFHGFAYLPARLPAGFDLDALR